VVTPAASSANPGDYYLLREISGLDPVKRHEIYEFGTGRSRVALIQPEPPPVHDRRIQTAPDIYHVVVYLVEDDGSPLDTWFYRTDPVNQLNRIII
jgi:hypothetical protein